MPEERFIHRFGEAEDGTISLEVVENQVRVTIELGELLESPGCNWNNEGDGVRVWKWVRAVEPEDIHEAVAEARRAADQSGDGGAGAQRAIEQYPEV